MCAKKAATTEKRKRTTKAKKEKDPDAPKRPLSSYMLFCQDERETVKEEHPTFKAKEILTELGKRWKALDEDDKKTYTDRFNENKKVYEVEKKKYDTKKKEEASDEEESEDEKPKKKAKKPAAKPTKKAPAKKEESEEESEDEEDDEE